jgi:hypothetical protein
VFGEVGEAGIGGIRVLSVQWGRLNIAFENYIRQAKAPGGQGLA